MSHGLLEILRFFLLALIWLFFVYAARIVLVEVRRSRAERAAAEVAGPAGAAGAATKGRPPPSQPAERGGSLKLRIVEPAERRGVAFELGGEITLGRSPGCAVSLEGDTFASSVHARVFRRDGETWLEDLGSTNGTFVNGERVATPVRLRRGDRLKVGHTLLEVGR
ncbi:MAG TPA: FHA domain-containing protein [Acidimicrobiales bacterium]|nr:FHA domain-containing protein [Acidimicrobiales bacterium]